MIDKLGFYKSKSGAEVEIVFFQSHGRSDFIAVGKVYHSCGLLSYTSYMDPTGEDLDDDDFTLIEFLRPSEKIWRVPRKTTFVTYLNEDYFKDFDLTNAGHIGCGMFQKMQDTDLAIKISKWRFYGEEIMEE